MLLGLPLGLASCEFAFTRGLIRCGCCGPAWICLGTRGVFDRLSFWIFYGCFTGGCVIVGL